MTKTFLDLFQESLEEDSEFKEYDPIQYLDMLEHLDVDVLTNSNGYVHAKTIQNMDDTARSFKQYLQTVWGKNALECFPLYYSKVSPAYEIIDVDIWLSPYMAWEYAVHQVRSVRKKQRALMWDAISARMNPRKTRMDKMRKDLEEQGHTDYEIQLILNYHFPSLN